MAYVTIETATRELLAEYAKYVYESVANGDMPYDFEDWQEANKIESEGL
jgi:hypothetical protein